ncbi:MAG: phosphoribosyltransferase [Acidobacteriaceae bacterium]
MIFKDREDAGRQLTVSLQEFANREDVIVLGIPRGGVTVAFAIAHALHLPLELFLAHKLGVPHHEELAFGAIAVGGGLYLDEQVVRMEGVSPQQIERVTEQVKQMLDRRAVLYRGNRPPLQVEARTVVLVDDGIATGASMAVAIHALRQMKPAAIVVAVPVAPASTYDWLRTLVDRLVCLYVTHDFYAVGQYFESFSQVEDEEVIFLLRRAETSSGM